MNHSHKSSLAFRAATLCFVLDSPSEVLRPYLHRFIHCATVRCSCSMSFASSSSNFPHTHVYRNRRRHSTAVLARTAENEEGKRTT